MLRSGRYPNASDNFKTDSWIQELFDGWFDPCPYNPDWEIDGIEIEWPKMPVFINPPYSNPTPWILKAIAHDHTVALLLKHDSAKFLLVSGRLKHQTGSPAGFPSVIAVLSKEAWE